MLALALAAAATAETIQHVAYTDPGCTKHPRILSSWKLDACVAASCPAHRHCNVDFADPLLFSLLTLTDSGPAPSADCPSVLLTSAASLAPGLRC